jgi:hypothetical protein
MNYCSCPCSYIHSKVHSHEIFDPRFCHQSTPSLGPDSRAEAVSQWDRGNRLFCQSSSLIITFSSNCIYVMFTYLFVFAMVSLKREWDPIIGIWSRGFDDSAESASADSLRLWNLLQQCSCRIPRSHWDRGNQTLQTIISNIFANTKPYAKRL